MKKLLFLIPIMAITLMSCYTTKVYKLEGKNYGAIQVIKSTKPVDSIWSNIIDLFATKGISIKVIDKSSGLIVTEKYNFKKHYSFEINGRLIDSTAWIALSYVAVKGGYGDYPVNVTADWNIRIKSDVTGSIINVNLTNIEAGIHLPVRNGGITSLPAQDFTFDGESTGVFEKLIIDIVK